MDMKRYIIFTGVSGLLLICSCDKQNALIAERAQIEETLGKMQEEVKAMDASLLSLGSDPYIAKINLDRQSGDLMKQGALLEKELADLSRKCTEGEESLERLRTRVDSYKANFMR